VHDRAERKADERGGEGAAENHDRRMRIEEHAKVAAHDDEAAKDDRLGKQTERRCDSMETPTPTRRTPSSGGIEVP